MTKEDPRNRLAPQNRVFKPELVLGIIVLDQPDEDAGTLEHIVSLASSGILDIVIHKSRNSSIRVHFEEFRGFLLLLVELDIDKIVRQLSILRVCFPQFLEESVNFESVWCALGKKVEFGFTIIGEFGVRLGEFGGLSVWHFGDSCVCK